MTQHMPLMTRYQLATHVLEGESFSEVAKRFNISKAGACKIFHLMKLRIFCSRYEIHEHNININDIDNLRDNWKRIKML